MALSGVEAVEVELGQLDFGAVQHSETHADEDLFDLVQGDIHGVAVAQVGGLAGNGHVHGLLGQTAVQGLLVQDLLPLLQSGGEGLPHLVGQLAHHGALLRGEFAHHFQQVGELTLLAQVLDPQLLQSGAVRSGGEGRQGLGADGF